MLHLHMRATARRIAAAGFAGAAVLGLGPAGAGAAAAALPAPVPTIADYQYLSGSTTPPSEANCFSVGRRCFTSTSMQNSYNLGPLYAAGNQGQGMTIAIVDSC